MSGQWQCVMSDKLLVCDKPCVFVVISGVVLSESKDNVINVFMIMTYYRGVKSVRDVTVTCY